MLTLIFSSKYVCSPEKKYKYICCLFSIGIFVARVPSVYSFIVNSHAVSLSFPLYHIVSKNHTHIFYRYTYVNCASVLCVFLLLATLEGPLCLRAVHPLYVDLCLCLYVTMPIHVVVSCEFTEIKDFRKVSIKNDRTGNRTSQFRQMSGLKQ